MILLLLACAGPEPKAEGGGETLAVVMDTLVFGRRDESGAAWGFDLDGHVSTPSDAEGCYRADLVDPEGRTGVDSAFSGMVPALEATEAGAVEGLIADSINTGELLLIAELTGVDDRVDDDCVDVTVWRGVGTPMVGTDGTLLDGQSFAVDPSLSSETVRCGTLAGGRLLAGPFALDLPLQVLDVAVDFHVQDARLRLDLAEDGTAWGYFGGGVPTADILRIVQEEGDLEPIKDLVVGLVEAAADLRTASGSCDGLSIVFEYTGEPAFVVD